MNSCGIYNFVLLNGPNNSASSLVGSARYNAGPQCAGMTQRQPRSRSLAINEGIVHHNKFIQSVRGTDFYGFIQEVLETGEFL
jgi:hypothetical protein